jgi:hypothetical protein
MSSEIGVPTVSGVGKGILGIGEKGIKGLFGITGTKNSAVGTHKYDPTEL